MIFILLGWLSFGWLALGLVYGKGISMYDSHKWEDEDIGITLGVLSAGPIAFLVAIFACFPYKWSLRPFTPIHKPTIGELMLEKLIHADDSVDVMQQCGQRSTRGVGRVQP